MMNDSNTSIPFKGGPIISISDMDSFMKLGESAQSARSNRPLKRTSSIDFDLLRASGDAARKRRSDSHSSCSSVSSSTYASPSSSPCSSPLLQPVESIAQYESRFDFMKPVEMPSPWKMTPSRYSRRGGRMDSVMNIPTPFEITSPLEIGMASQLRIISLDEFYEEGNGNLI